MRMKKTLKSRFLSGFSALALALTSTLPMGLTLGVSAADSYDVSVNVYEHDGSTYRTITWDENPAGYYLLVVLKDDEDKNVAWSVKQATLGYSATSSLDTFYLFGTDGSDKTDDAKVSFADVEYASATVRLFTTANFWSDENATYASFLDTAGDKQSGVDDNIPGYTFMSTTTAGTTDALVELKKNVSTYAIDVTVDDSVTEADNLYLVTAVQHASDITYNVQKVTGTQVYTLQTETENTGVWYKADGSVKDGENVTGNEASFTPCLVKAEDGMTEADIAKAAAESPRQFIVVDDETVAGATDLKTTKQSADGVTTVVSNFRIAKTTVSGGENFETILGNAVNFGIVADRWNKTEHAQTNYAVNYYQEWGKWVQPDLTGGFGGHFYVPYFVNFNGKTVVDDDTYYYSADEEYGKLWFGNRTHQETAALHVDDPNRLNPADKATDKGGYIDVVVQDADSIKEGVIDPMINAMKAKSTTLASHSVSVAPYIENQKYTIDTLDYPDNATVYVDGDALAAANGGLINDKVNVKLKEGQTIIFNFTSTDTLKIGQFLVEYHKKDGTVDSHVNTAPNTSRDVTDENDDNAFLEKLCKDIVWNLNSVKTVDLSSTAGIFLNPNPDSVIDVSSTATGWICTAGYLVNEGEWHNAFSELKDVVSEQTYSIDLSKYDTGNKDLAGAVLGLYPVSEGVVADSPSATITSSGKNPDSMTVKPGRYAIKEISAPDGYEKDENTVYYIEVLENENDKSVTINVYPDATYSRNPTDSQTYSPNALGENTYKDAAGNEYTFKNVTNLNQENGRPDVYKNGTQITDEEELAKFTFTAIDGTSSQVVAYDGTEIVPANGSYPIGGTSFAVSINDEGQVTKAVAADYSDISVTYNRIGNSWTLNCGSESVPLRLEGNFNLYGSSTGRATLPGIGEVKVTFNSVYGTYPVTSLEITDLTKFEIKNVADYTVAYNGEVLSAQIGLSSRLASGFEFFNGRAFTVNKVQENGTTPLPGATIALVEEKYTVSEGELAISESTPIPADNSSAAS